MSLRWSDWSYERVLAGIAGTDVLVRVVPELLGLGDSLLLPVAFVLTSQFVLDWGTVGWALGWTLFASVVFQLAPLLFPRRLHEWAHGLPNRFTMAVSTVAVGVFLEKLLVESLGFGTTPLPVPTAFFPVVVLFVFGLCLVARFVTPVRVDTPFLYSFDASVYPVAESEGMLVVTQQLFVVCFVGLLLAELSLLFPLPELLVLSVVGYDGVAAVMSDVEELPSRRDVAERVVQASTAVWHGPRGIIWALYATAGLFAAFFVDYLYVDALELWALSTVRPVDAAFAAYTLAGMTVLVAIATLRLAERIPLELQDGLGDQIARERLRPNVSPAGVSTTNGGPRNEGTPLADDSTRRLPGLMVPAALLVMSLELARPNYTGDPPVSQIPPLELSAPIVALAVVAGVVGVATVVRPDAFPSSGLSDYQAGAVSVACFFTLGLGVGFFDVAGSATGSKPALVVTVSNVVLWAGVTLAPFVGYELDPIEDYENRGKALVEGLGGSVVLLVGSVVFFFLVRGFVGVVSPSPTLEQVGTLVGVFPAATALMSAAIRLVLVVPYLGEVLHYVLYE
ncbi:hypothetical protein [Haloarcula marina]|uniref:hypothetical protein n=1 Tax=Haloarcula marina TaxID=2961574 RepID=UPI0020B784C3|nr:hypothetical protein [Halomicroarcula marina]